MNKKVDFGCNRVDWVFLMESGCGWCDLLWMELKSSDGDVAS